MMCSERRRRLWCMNCRSIVGVLALLAASACSEPLEFADWTILVPEGTRVIEYAAAVEYHHCACCDRAGALTTRRAILNACR